MSVTVKGAAVTAFLLVAFVCEVPVLVGLARASSEQAGAGQGTRTQATFEYSPDADTLILQLTQDVGIIDPDSTPLLRLYGDGRVSVHFPAYMKRAGDYSLQLTQAEMEALLSSLVQGGLIDFSPEATQAQMRQVAAARRAQATQAGQRAVLTTRSDEATVSIEIRLNRYIPAGGPARDNVTKRLSWTGVGDDAEQYPSITALQALAAVQRQLLALTERADLTRVNPEQRQ